MKISHPYPANVGKNELYIVGGIALTLNPSLSVIEEVLIYIRDGKIAKLGRRGDFPIPKEARILDGNQCLVLPGLINGHTHVGMGLFRGVAEDLPLARWLGEAIFPLEEKWVSEDFVYLGTLLSVAEMIRSGTTTFNNMDYFSEVVARATHKAGLRSIGGQTYIDTLKRSPPGGLAGFYDEYLAATADYELHTPALAPHSIYGVSKEALKGVLECSEKRNLRIHIHLAETEDEVEECRKLHGKSPVEYLNECGFWSYKVIVAHGTCLSEKDIQILGRNRIGIAHNAESNLKLGTRICPVVELREAGCPVALGTDGVASNNNLDLLGEADIAAKLQTFRKGAGALKAQEVVRMLTVEGARALGLDSEIGSLEVGKAADIIAVDIHNPHSVPFRNPYTHLVYSASGMDVKHSVVAGRILMENRELLTVDEQAIIKEAEQWKRRMGV